MNILISKHCNRRCSFCFARQRLGKNAVGGAPFMSRENLRRIMTFLKSSGDTNLRLLGGEPTMHPQFTDLVQEALDEGFSVHIFTNGMMPEKTADFLGAAPEGKVTLLCNVSPQANDTPPQKARLEYALSKLSRRLCVGITITSTKDNFDFLHQYLDTYGLQRHVRVGIGQPIVGQSNDFVPPSTYPEVGTFIMDLAEQFHSRGVLLGFDCGLTLCMFTEAQIGRLFFITEGFKMLCDPIIDVGPDMDLWHCFPLSNVLVSQIDRFANQQEIVNHYQKAVRAYKSMGCRPECLQCKYLRTRQCNGGCLAHAMNALSRKPPAELQAQP